MIMKRRSFLKVIGLGTISLFVPTSCTKKTTLDERNKIGPVRFGVFSDAHYADRDPAGSRHYRDSMSKLAECIERMNTERLDFMIELGDLKDQDNPPKEQHTLSYLQSIEAIFRQFNGPTYHVLGNHDMDSISKVQFLAHIKNTRIASDRTYYSFDVNKCHFVVLDANYRSDGTDYDHGNFNWTDANIPPAELAWLEQDLATATGPTIVFTHQLLDEPNGVHPSLYIKNSAQVRQVLQQSGKVRAVLQGHHHAGSYCQIEGIHYYTIKGMIEGAFPENNAYAIVEVLPESIIITGYRTVVSKKLLIQPNAPLSLNNSIPSPNLFIPFKRRGNINFYA